MPGGVGTSPFGLGPYGYGTPPVPAASAPPNFSIKNQVSGIGGSCRLIDKESRQYVFDSTGRIAGSDNIPQLVFLAYATHKGSSVSPALGESFTDVAVIGDDFQQTMTDLATVPIQPLIDQGLVQLVGVDVIRVSPDAVAITIRWRDLTTGAVQTFTI